MIYLVEQFYSIQGEGKFLGTPSLFFRFGGCNLKCEGFGCKELLPNGDEIVGCDTVYAVDRSFQNTWIKIKSTKELFSIIELYELPKKVDIVFTGGEPLLNIKDEIFLEFVKELVEDGYRITFETNATIDVDFEKYPFFRECVFALSVKLANSHEEYKKRVKPHIIKNIATNSKNSFFKFSIDKDSIDAKLDSEIEDIISNALFLDVYCMPLGGTKEEIEKNSLALIEYCKEKGYIYSDRLHIRIWDSNKGV